MSKVSDRLDVVAKIRRSLLTFSPERDKLRADNLYDILVEVLDEWNQDAY